MALRRQFKSKAAKEKFRKANHLIQSSNDGGGGNEVHNCKYNVRKKTCDCVWEGAFYPTNKTPAKLKETPGQTKASIVERRRHD